MANEINNTTADVLIPELWRPKMFEARYPASVMLKRVVTVDDEVSEKGDILHLPIEPVVATNAVGADGSVTNQALTPTESQLVVDNWREATIDVVDKAQKQSTADLMSVFIPGFAKAIAAYQDSVVLAKHADLTSSEVGDSLTEYSGELILAALQKLIDLNVPVDNMDDISAVLHTSKWSVLKNIDKFSFANYTGMAMGGQMKYEAPAPYGVPHFFSTQVVSSTGYHNLVFHRQAFGIGTQKNFRIEKLARTKKSTPISGDILFGVKTIRQDHGVDMVTK